MASSQSSREDDDNHQNQIKKHKKKLKRDLKSLETALEKQEGRLSHLQSSAFQLANYYFVFQGIILTALCNRNTVLRCSTRWFLATLSALAAAINLAALVSIGRKYNRIITHRARTYSTYNELQGKLSDLEQQEQQRQQLSSRNLSGLSSRGSLNDASNSLDPSQDDNLHTSGHVWDYADLSDVVERELYLWVCILIFISFAVVVLVGCLKFLC